MFESHLAPASGLASPHRDLSCVELWETSLERSRRRRELAATHRKAAPRRKGTAAAMSAALFVSPILPMTAAGARGGGGEAASAPPSDGQGIGGTIARFGDVGAPVAALQRELGIDDDGIFGPVTRGAVRDFQARQGLPRTGAVDARTWQALFASSISFVPPASAAAKQVLARAPERPRAPRIRAVAASASTARSGGTAPVVRPRRGDTPRRTVNVNAPTPPAPAPATPAPAPPAAPAGECGGPIVTPVSGTRTSGFGDGRNHGGVDIAAPSGTPVRAAACGIVTEAGVQGGYGNIVCIRHSATFSTCYAHLSRIGTRAGAYVKVGEVIGAVGSTGRSTGPHLHFETRVNGRAQDPTPYLSGAAAIPGGQGVARPARSSSRTAAPARARVLQRSAARPQVRQAVAAPAPAAPVAAAPAAPVAPPPPPVEPQAAAPPVEAAAPQAPPPAVAPAPVAEPAPGPAAAPTPAPAETPASPAAPAPEPAAAQAPAPEAAPSPAEAPGPAAPPAPVEAVVAPAEKAVETVAAAAAAAAAPPDTP